MLLNKEERTSLSEAEMHLRKNQKAFNQLTEEQKYIPFLKKYKSTKLSLKITASKMQEYLAYSRVKVPRIVKEWNETERDAVLSAHTYDPAVLYFGLDKHKGNLRLTVLGHIDKEGIYFMPDLFPYRGDEFHDFMKDGQVPYYPYVKEIRLAVSHSADHGISGESVMKSLARASRKKVVGYHGKVKIVVKNDKVKIIAAKGAKTSFDVEKEEEKSEYF